MNYLLAIPLELRLLVVLSLGAALGSLVNLLVEQFKLQPRRISPWEGIFAARGPKTPVKPASPPARGTDKPKQPPQAPLAGWRDRIPVFGWLFWSRAASVFGPAFWVRPFLVELVSGGLLAWLYYWETEQAALWPSGTIRALSIGRDVLHAQFAGHAVLYFLLLFAALIDWDELHIPDIVTVPGALAGLVLGCLVPWTHLPDAVFWPTAGPIILEAGSPNLWPEALSQRGDWGLWAAVGCLWFWCVALMPRVWRPRRGLSLAGKIFLAYLARMRITYAALAIGVIGTLAILAGWKWLDATRWQGLLSSLIGLACGVLVIWTVRLIAGVVMRREAMGFGDVTLVAMIGAFLGWQPVLILFFIGPWYGLVFALVLLVRRKGLDHPIPYGPFLCLGALTTVVYWQWLWSRAAGAFAIPGLVPGILAACGPLMALLLGLSQLVKRLFRARGPTERLRR